jgi:glutaredoxin 3
MSAPVARVILYTRAFCGYCTAAEKLLKAKGVNFEHEDLTGDSARRKWLAEVTGRTTVPQCFINGTPVGGYSDLRELDRSGELDRMLAQPPPAA